MKHVAATLTRDRYGAPLVVLEGPPFNGLEINPVALRELASQLTALAHLAAQRPAGGKHWRPMRVALQMGNSEPAQPGQASVPDEGWIEIFSDMFEDNLNKKGQ